MMMTIHTLLQPSLPLTGPPISRRTVDHMESEEREGLYRVGSHSIGARLLERHLRHSRSPSFRFELSI